MLLPNGSPGVNGESLATGEGGDNGCAAGGGL
jgi:hypothetical protein